jgi:hypothetical protein
VPLAEKPQDGSVQDFVQSYTIALENTKVLELVVSQHSKDLIYNVIVLYQIQYRYNISFITAFGRHYLNNCQVECHLHPPSQEM